MKIASLKEEIKVLDKYLRMILKYILLISALLSSSFAYCQAKQYEFCLNFRVNSTEIDSTFQSNDSTLHALDTFLSAVRRDSTISITGISFCGSASPEGSNDLNLRLGRQRLSQLEKYVRNSIDIPDSIITRDESYIPWIDFTHAIAQSDIEYKDTIMSILREEPQLVQYYYTNQKIDHRIVKLQKLDRGRVWRKIIDAYFGPMRNAYAIFVTYKQKIERTPAPIVLPAIDESEATTIFVMPTDTVAEEPPVWRRKLHVKTNALAWGFAISNIAVEIDIAKHWSATLPVYWSSWNYLKSTRKFRTLALQPEVRYWLSEDNEGWFGGAHFGLAWFNLALDGNKYRFQDHDGSSPALGGGIAVGYRMPISANKHWHLEFTVGAGAYSINYDKFYNEPNGLLIDTTKKTYIGLDQAAVTVSYSFNLNK